MNDGQLLGIGLGGLVIYLLYRTSKNPNNGISALGRPTQKLYSDAARIPDGALMAGTRRVHPNRTDYIGENGVIYVGYFMGGEIPSSTKAKHGWP